MLLEEIPHQTSCIHVRDGLADKEGWYLFTTRPGMPTSGHGVEQNVGIVGAASVVQSTNTRSNHFSSRLPNDVRGSTVCAMLML